MVNPMPVQFAPYRPDLADYNPSFSDAIMNVEPKPDGFGPLPAFEPFGDLVLATEDEEVIITEDGFSFSETGIGGECYGAVTTRPANDINRTFAGTLTGLYRFSASGANWADVSRTSGGAYTMTADNWWSFAQFGDRLIACNGVDATQYIDISSGSNFAALTNAPIARIVSNVGDFLLFGNLSTDAAAVQWSAVNNSEDYTNGGSDIQSFPDGGPVMNIIGHSLGAVIFQRDKLRLMEWRGDDLVWGFRVVQEAIGCFAPRSVVQARNSFMWYGDGGFFEGLEARPIGDDHVNRTVEQIFDADARKRLIGSVDPLRNMVWWTGTRTDGTRRMIGYDYVLGQWTQAETDATFIFPAYTPGYTIDDIGALGYSMDTIPYPFDSSFWVGTGELVLAGFNEFGQFGFFQGDPLPATLETTDLTFTQGGYSFLQSARLVIGGDYAPVDLTAITVEVGTRDYPGGPITWSDAVGVTASNGRSWHRKYGNTHRIRWTIASTTWKNAQGATVFVNQAGNR